LTRPGYTRERHRYSFSPPLCRVRANLQFFGPDGTGRLTIEQFIHFLDEYGPAPCAPGAATPPLTLAVVGRVQDDILHLDFLRHKGRAQADRIEEVSAGEWQASVAEQH
jgi:hypothetical protein